MTSTWTQLTCMQYLRDLKYRLGRHFWFNDMPGRAMLDKPLQLAKAAKATLFPRRSFAIEVFRASPTNICNAACVFCAYPQAKANGMPGHVMSMETFRSAMPFFARLNQRVVDLGPAVGDPLVDPKLGEKAMLLAQHGYKWQFTTNGILLHKHLDWIFDNSASCECIYVSFGSLDPEEFKLQYGVDKGEQLNQNLRNLLARNNYTEQPLEIKVMFRNREHSKHTLQSPTFQALKHYFHGRVSYHFTHVWDNWSDAVDFSKWSKHMKSRIRWVPKLNKPCVNLRTALVNPDGKVRLCGCRVVKTEDDDLVVGSTADSYDTLNGNAAAIRQGFYKGIRPEVCQKCSFYSPE